MKIRLYQDSLRLRLSPDEVRQLDQTGNLHQTTHFGVGVELTCKLQMTAAAKEIHATLHNNTIVIDLPRTLADNWAKGDQVGLTISQPAGDGRWLKILIEKDFECLHPQANEPNASFYPNPRKLSST
ncbi:MAG: hypothetical protein M3O30_03075 [Planctomycetota bacterium]|nr:hypothetical protein [Planctomycetota bacterium]